MSNTVTFRRYASLERPDIAFEPSDLFKVNRIKGRRRYVDEIERQYYEGFAYRPPSAATLASPKAQKAYHVTNDQWIVNLRQPKTTKCPVTGSVTTTFDVTRKPKFKLTPNPQEVPMNIPKNCYVLLCLSTDSPRLLYPKVQDSGEVKFGAYADELEGDFVFDRGDISSDELRPLAAKYHAVFICKLADVIHFEMKSLVKE